jgi:hypothetical protein
MESHFIYQNVFPSTPSISMYTVPAAYLICIAPQTFAKYQSQRAYRGHRDIGAIKLARANDASKGGLKGLGFFAGSVVAANLALIVVHANAGTLSGPFGVVRMLGFRLSPVKFVNSMSLMYLMCRIGAMYDYIFWNDVYGAHNWDYATSWAALSLYWWAADTLSTLIR